MSGRETHEHIPHDAHIEGDEYIPHDIRVEGEELGEASAQSVKCEVADEDPIMSHGATDPVSKDVEMCNDKQDCNERSVLKTRSQFSVNVYVYRGSTENIVIQWGKGLHIFYSGSDHILRVLLGCKAVLQNIGEKPESSSLP